LLLLGLALGGALVLTARTGAPASRVTAAQEAPPGRWRLVSPRELDTVVLYLSHVLIRHQAAEPAIVPFNAGHWRAMPPPPPRSRDEARALARDLAARAAGAPHTFADLARAHSDDALTAPRGGSLGSVRAGALTPWPEVLDALASLKDGDVSGVVETRFGFHVFRRHAPPPQLLVAGRRLVVGYDAATWLDVVGRPDRVRPRRTRAQAEAVANELLARARAAPRDFGALIQARSEHMDAASQGGDLGAWSTREPSDVGREVQVLASLKIGEISAPIESPVGLELLQRTELGERPSFAMAAVELWFDREAPASSETSRPSTRATAARLAQAAVADANLFREARGRFGGEAPLRWTRGRGPVGVEEPLGRIGIGEIGREPIESLSSMFIVQRLEPAAVPLPPAPRFTLPSPSEPDLQYFIGAGDAEQLGALLRAVAGQYQATLGTDAALAASFAGWEAALEGKATATTDARERVATYQRATTELARLAGAAGARRYQQLLASRLETLLLGSRSP
jgi:hypothetical protein